MLRNDLTVPRWWYGVLMAGWITCASVPVAVGEASPAVALDEGARAAAALPRLHSLLVSWRGELILERYYNGAHPTRLANVKSVSKSIISALVGIAI